MKNLCFNINFYGIGQNHVALKVIHIQYVNVERYVRERKKYCVMKAKKKQLSKHKFF
jgi:hypothetical protein